MSKVETPLKWLLAQLPALIEPAPLDSLMMRYRRHTLAYNRQLDINRIERTIKTIQYRNSPSDAAKLLRWHAKLDKLKREGL